MAIHFHQLHDQVWLNDRYIVEKLSVGKIALLVNCGRSSVIKALTRNNITIRKAGEWFDYHDIIGCQFGNLIVKSYINQKLFTRCYYLCECQCECKNKIDVRRDRLLSGGTTSCGCLHTIKNLHDIVGKQFGKLIVLKYLGRITTKTQKVHSYLCRCSCGLGKEVEVNRYNLINGQSASCGCMQHRKGSQSSNWGGFGEISQKLWREILKGAVGRSKKVNITIDDAWNQFKKQDMKCIYTGIPLVMHRFNGVEKERTASLDRRDNKVDYEPDNIQWVHKDINHIKWKLTEARFLELCTLVTNPLPIESKKLLISQECEKVARYKSWCGYEELSGKFWGKINLHAKSRCINVDITIEDAYTQYEKQHKQCAITGLPLVMYTTNSKLLMRTASLDRIDNEKGYTKDNIQWVHKEINIMKWTYNQEKFIELCKAVFNHTIKF